MENRTEKKTNLQTIDRRRDQLHQDIKELREELQRATDPMQRMKIRNSLKRKKDLLDKTKEIFQKTAGELSRDENNY